MGWGAYGKIPALGDFVRVDLAPAFVTPWDRWLQEGIAGARRSLGSGFAPRYNRAPVWRFALAPGVAGPMGAAGVVMPSVDRVGRAFPLTLAALAPGLPPDPEGAEALAEADEAALAMLDPGAGRDALRAALAALAPPEGRAAPPGATFWTPGRRIEAPLLRPALVTDLLLDHAETA